MLVNAAEFPGPALWHGIMLLTMPAAMIGLALDDGQAFPWIVAGYLVFGVVLAVAIVLWV